MNADIQALQDLITRHGARVTERGRPDSLSAEAAVEARAAGRELHMQPSSVGLMVITVDGEAGSRTLDAVHDATDDDPIIFDAASAGERRLWYRQAPRTEPDGVWRAGTTVTDGACELPEPARLVKALATRDGRRPTTTARLPGWRPRT